LRAVLDGVTDGIVVLGRDGRCRYLNESAGALLGRVRARMLGRQIWAQLLEDLLRELGADYAQGFHLGRPAPMGPPCH
jgi:PAS domain S-box-containing protein